MCWVRRLTLTGLAPLLALGGQPARASGEPSPAPLVQAEAAAPGRTRLRFALPGRAAATLLVRRDDDVPAAAEAERVEVLARVGDGTVVLVETYPSRLNRGAGTCGAGQERLLRVVRVLPAPARQTYVAKLASCWKNIELDDEFAQRGWRWSPDVQELRIEWFSGPTQQAPEVRRLRIDADGRVTELKPA